MRIQRKLTKKQMDAAKKGKGNIKYEKGFFKRITGEKPELETIKYKTRNLTQEQRKRSDFWNEEGIRTASISEKKRKQLVTNQEKNRKKIQIFDEKGRINETEIIKQKNEIIKTRTNKHPIRKFFRNMFKRN
jgi:hypothetical protein